jgi:hypothetical protein
MEAIGMPEPTSVSNLEDLINRSAIGDLITNYGTGIDRRDWRLYRSVFMDQVTVDFSSAGGASRVFSADDWVEHVRDMLSCFDATQHNITNHVITLAVDTATIVANLVARHVFEGGIQLMGGFYTNDLVRVDEEWKISVCRLTMTWEQGDRELFLRASMRGPRARVDVGAQGMYG